MSGRPRIRRWGVARAGMVLVAVALVMVVVAAPVPGGSGEGVSARDPEPAAVERDPETVQLRRELDDLVDAWAVGGGTFGFPFWERAGRRWAAGEITTPMYREYVTGYRDRVRAGCQLLDSVRVRHSVARDVRGLVEGACRRRIEALGSQQRWLETLAQVDAPTAGPLDETARNERAAALQAEAADHERAYREAIQASYRDARLAMELAQSALVAGGVARLAEDAFI
jgi:hypothetical protein